MKIIPHIYLIEIHNKKVNSITNNLDGVESWSAKASAAERVDCGLLHEMI